jgi:carboxypeptidase A, invertebrate
LQSHDLPLFQYKFVDSPVQVHTEINILVPPNKLEPFDELMKRHAFENALLHENFQALVDAEQPTRMPKAFGWTAYYPLQDIYSFLDDMVGANPNAASHFDIGSSYEGRLTRGLKISYKAGNKAIFIEANIHAREWISSATATWTINELLSSSNPEIRRIAESYDWYFIPVANPDGYEYTRTVDRIWRKTRSPQAGGCFGVDPNRNFGYKWMGEAKDE